MFELLGVFYEIIGKGEFEIGSSY